MNRMRIIILLVALALVFTEQSCTEEGPKTYKNSVVSLSPMILSLSRNTLDFSTFESSSQTLYVTSTGTDWEFTDIPDWLIFNPSAGGKGTIPVEVICSKNEDIEKRIGIISFRSIRSDWNYSTKLSVSQIRNVYTAVPEKESIEFAWTESQAIVKINANIDSWEVAPESVIKSWCNVRKLDDAIEINCSENTSTNPRNGKIEIKTEDKVQYINIVQSPIELDLQADSTALFFSDKAGSSQLLVKTYPGVHWIASTQYDWISLSPQEGTGDGIFNVTVTENTDSTLRTGLVNVATNESQVSMAVNQTGKFFDISSPLLSFGSQGGDVKVSIKTNDGWSASTTCEWIELSDTIGNTDCNVILKVLDNNTASDRDGTVIITPNHLNSVSLTVYQKARYLELSDSALIFWYSDTTKDMIVYTDGEFEAYSDCSWLSFDNDDNKLTVKVCGFDEEESVIDTIKVALKGLSSGTLIKKVPVYLYGTNDCFVDLGLSVKWAVRNVGANSIEDYGDYYAWGETEPYYEDGHSQDAGYGYGDDSGLFWKDGKSEGYNWSSYKYCNGQESSLTKYCNNSNYGYNGYTDNKTSLDLEDDVAHLMWGGDWRMPTDDEFEELFANCYCYWTAQNGVKGYIFVSKVPGYSGRSIFLPAGGYYYGVGLDKVGNEGDYWSSTLDVEYPCMASGRKFSADFKSWSGSYRYKGHSVRPVLPFSDNELKEIHIDKNEVTLIPGAEWALNAKVIKNDSRSSVLNLKALWTSDNDSVASIIKDKITEKIILRANNVGTCFITASYGPLSVKCMVTVLSSDLVDYIDHDYVDLGLSVQWATVNVGAYMPETSGDYYAWGETEPYYEKDLNDELVWRSDKSSGYTWQSYFDAINYGESFAKYNGKDERLVLDSNDDVAHVKWGGDWRMPTDYEFEELIEECTWREVQRYGVWGYAIESKKTGYEGNSIFLPSAGYRTGAVKESVYDHYYWTSSFISEYLYGEANSSAVGFYSASSYYSKLSYNNRYLGFTVRPVIPFTDKDLKEIKINANKISLYSGETDTLRVTLYKKNGKILSGYSPKWNSSDEMIATVSSTGAVKALGVGTCVVKAYFGSIVDSCTITVNDPNSIAHDYVDLGLSVKWATTNVGAYSPEAYGDYFAWGETEPYYESGQAHIKGCIWKSGKTSGYYWLSYKYCSSEIINWVTVNTIFKYNDEDKKAILDLEDDAAHVLWGGNWRMPTKDEFEELIDKTNCNWTYTTRNGVKGYLITSRITGNSIFLPASGSRYTTKLIDFGSVGYYWTSTLMDQLETNVWALSFSSGGFMLGDSRERCYGHQVRPVCP